MGKFEIIKSRDGMYRFNLRASNGEIIAASEPFGSEMECRKGIERARALRGSAVEDQINGKEQLTGAKYEIFLDKAGEFRFRLRMANGSLLFRGEGYRSKASCRNGIKSVEKNAGDAPVISLI